MHDRIGKMIGTEQRYLCVSRPRRFGKSVTAHMLAAYYCKGVESSAIFDAYQIAKLFSCFGIYFIQCHREHMHILLYDIWKCFL